MLILLSPSKRMADAAVLASNAPPATNPRAQGAAQDLVNRLRRLSVEDLAKTLHISQALAATNYQRWQNTGTLPLMACVLAYQGDGFVALGAGKWSPETWQKAQRKLRILSGLYGMLTPTDAVRPYRLEMATVLPDDPQQSLADTWRKAVTAWLVEDLAQTGVSAPALVVNLASQQYTDAIDWLAVRERYPDLRVIQPRFQRWHQDKWAPPGQQIRALRGALCRHLLEQPHDHSLDIGVWRSFHAYDYHWPAATASPSPSPSVDAPLFVRKTA